MRQQDLVVVIVSGAVALWNALWNALLSLHYRKVAEVPRPRPQRVAVQVELMRAKPGTSTVKHRLGPPRHFP